MRKETSNKITLGMFICSIIIVLHHSSAYAYYELDLYNKIAVRFYHDGLFIFAMPFFFFWSGFFCINQYMKYKSNLFWKKKVHSLIVPYLAWNLLATIATLFMHILVDFVPKVIEFKWQDFDFSFLGWLTGILLYKYNGQFWYMFQLIVLLPFTPLIYRMMQKKKIFCGIGLLGVVLFYIIKGDMLRFSLSGLLFYLFGGWISVNGEKYIEYSHKKITALSFLILSFIIIILSVCEGEIPRVLYLGLQMSALILFWECLQAFNNIRVCMFMRMYFFVYAFHNVPLAVLNRFFANHMPKEPFPFLWFSVLLSIIIIYAVMYLIIKIMKKHTPRLLNWLNGGRG